MFKYFVAAAVALSATPASAQSMMISAGRQTVLTEAAKSVCRTVIEGKEQAGPAFDRQTAHLSLMPDEKLYLLSLCILYAQGRIDQIKAQ